MAASMQGHLHLELTGGEAAFVPDDEYKATVREPVPMIHVSFNRGITGVPHFATLLDTGEPVIFRDFSYTLRLTETELEAVILMAGGEVYLIDQLHDPDAHSSYVRKMGFSQIGRPRMANVKGVYYDLDVYLTDLETIAG